MGKNETQIIKPSDVQDEIRRNQKARQKSNARSGKGGSRINTTPNVGSGLGGLKERDRQQWLAKKHEESIARIPDFRRAQANVAADDPTIKSLDGVLLKFVIAALEAFQNSPVGDEKQSDPIQFAIDEALRSLTAEELEQKTKVELAERRVRKALDKAFRVVHRSISAPAAENVTPEVADTTSETEELAVAS